jgi:molybdopterin-containing oxidoreductase family membrane subunit
MRTPASLELTVDDAPSPAERCARITAEVCAPLDSPPGARWWLGVAVASAALAMGVASIGYELAVGVGAWGLNNVVGWGWDITNFVFWIGIGHAGTFISAILVFFRQRWRTRIGRAAETMTLLSVLCAVLFPVIHLGRPWLAFWVLPVPNARGPLWVNFYSPLLWDVFAVGTYLCVSMLFWYLGLVPDAATVRDRSSGLRRRVFGALALGWEGSARDWAHHESAHVLLAGIASVLVVSVHSLVSMDFAASTVTGWHVTLFPPYFVAGAVFSGMAMVVTVVVVARTVLRLDRIIEVSHLDAAAKVMLGAGCVVALAYGTELVASLYGANPLHRFEHTNRAFGPNAWAFWVMLACNVAVPQLLWLRRVRARPLALLLVSILVNVGMWHERFVIVAGSLQRDVLPATWSTYAPTLVEVGALVGTFGLFLLGLLAAARFLPLVGMAELKAAVAREPAAASEPRALEAVVRELGPRHEEEALVLLFEDSRRLVHAAQEARAAGLRIVDALSPYPVDGLAALLRIAPSRAPLAAACAGLVGGGSALLLELYASAVSWPLRIGGKSPGTLTGLVPVAFEVTLLCAALAGFTAFLVGARLSLRRPRWRLPGVADDRFALALAMDEARAGADAAENVRIRFGATTALVHRRTA